MHLHLTVFTGVVPREWVAVHRKHHHLSDGEGDPHSPLVFGLWTVLFGNYFLYKKETGNQATIKKYTPEWKNDLIDYIPMMHYGVFFGLGVFCLMFGLQWGVVAWISHIVLYVLLNSSINALGHTIGYRNFDQQATNLQWLAFLTAGEGLHNNHHEHPTSARFSLRGREIDPSWPIIRLLESLGLAKVSQLPMAKAA
jgi:stearoyl-CoA desaturase (delta-9 desaturase)